MVERVPSGTAVDLGGSNPSLDTWGHFCTLMIFIIKVQLWQEKKKSTITFIRPQILKMATRLLVAPKSHKLWSRWFDSICRYKKLVH